MAKFDSPFRHFDSTPEVICLVAMMHAKYPLSLRNLEYLLAERGIDISHETVRLWWNRFGPMSPTPDKAAALKFIKKATKRGGGASSAAAPPLSMLLS